MKAKIFITFIVAFFYVANSYSQVGIGTDSPTETLDIDGTVRVRDIDRLPGDYTSAKDSIVVFNSDGVLKFVSSNLLVSTADASAFPDIENFTSGSVDPTTAAEDQSVGDTYQNTTDNSWWYYDGNGWLKMSSANVDDADADPTNEIQAVASADGSVTVTANGNDFDLSVAAADGSETVVQAAGASTITGTGTSADPYIVTSTDNVDDADADPTNEIQTVASADGSVTVTANGNDFDLSVAAADGSETVVQAAGASTISGSGTSADPYIITSTDNVDDADADPTNEIQSFTSTDESMILTPTNDDYDLSYNLAKEPWYDMTTNTGATALTDNIYHMGNVGIGDNTAGIKFNFAGQPRTGAHTTTPTWYATGGIGQLSNGFEFLHTNGTAGYGIGWGGIYSTGTNAANNDFIVRTERDFVIQTRTGTGGYRSFVFRSDAIFTQDNFVSLGIPSGRFRSVWAVNGVIQTSDARLKKNVENIKYGIDEVMKLRPVSYDWKDGTGDNKLGFIAQELREVVPSIVIGDEDKENLGVNYADLVPLLTKAIQEQQQTMDSQDQKLQEQANAIHAQQQIIESQEIKLQEQAQAIQEQQAEMNALKKMFEELKNSL